MKRTISTCLLVAGVLLMAGSDGNGGWSLLGAALIGAFVAVITE